MRFPILVLTASAAGLLAVAAVAQDAEPGLSDLGNTLQGLDDETPPVAEAPPAEATPESTPEETAPPPEPAPTETPPADTPPAEAPAPEAAATPPRQAEPLTREQTAQLAAAAQRGQQLTQIARAGILGTQDMLSRVSDPEGAGIAGWIAEPEGNGTEVIFYARGEAGPVAVYRANILGPRVVSRDVFIGADRPALGPIEARMAQARDATEALDHQACGTQPFNVFVIPPASATAPVDVYQTSAATQRGRFPLGGHFKSTVAADGSVTASRGFTNACVDIAVPDAPAGQPVRPIAITHLLDPLPTEIHVFLAEWAGRPLLVVADDPQRVFLVTGERIAEVRDRPANQQ